MRLKDKIALITGAGGGIGQAITELFLKEGAKVAISDIGDGETGDLANRIANDRAIRITLDVTRPDQWKNAVEEVESRLGPLNILVNNAGMLGRHVQTPETVDIEEWRLVSSVNVEGVILGCQNAIAAMKSGGGSIVNISSVAGIIGSPRTMAYGASKATVRQLTKSVAAYCGQQKFNIRCNSVHPGFVDTAMGQSVFEWSGIDPEIARANRIASIPLGRLAQPIDVAQAVLYLASDESAYVTGAELVVDGGMVIL